MVSVWFGLTLGACAWSIIRGRGGVAGLFGSMSLGAAGACIGWLAAQAITQDASFEGPMLVGAILGALLAAVVVVAGWGPRARYGEGASRPAFDPGPRRRPSTLSA
jgi:uncharacterized membrane protein YeaQ/YmgE (transglycosylase-associated protein family)